ncbi:MAG: metallophosphoesterase [Microcoleus vaginatus WJT46-NPBG5]|jgi:predicted MPP superfamily phosphohydrolase|nr:metallophosphoesterase [Microcoleus vaginatus WJT46-NPBG5]
MAPETHTIPYNLIMTGGDVALLWLVRRKMPKMVQIAGFFTLATFGLIAPFFLGEYGLGILQLLAYGIFVHGFIVLTGLAIILRPLSRKMAIAAAVAAVFLGTIAVDAFAIEPAWLEVSHVQLRTPKLETPLKVAVVADFQTDVWGEYERQALRLTMAEKPDLILLAGDYLQEFDEQRREILRQKFNSFLQKINFSAPLGTYAVVGDTESFIDPTNWPQAFEGLPVTALRTKTTLLLPEFCLTGLPLAASRNSRLKVAPCDRFHIVLGHAPDFALGDIDADLLVAGHTHGGQVRLPLVGPVLTRSKIPRSWAAGVTKLTGNRTLIVSRELGCSEALHRG